MSVLLETSHGDLVIDLFLDEAPLACENFLKLAKMKFFHNSAFHRLERDLILEGGRNWDTKKASTIWKELEDHQIEYERRDLAVNVDRRVNDYCTHFPDELSSRRKHNAIGMVGCANVRPDENDSSFYITLNPELKSLDLKHTIFGQVSEGIDEVLMKKINPMLVDKETKEPVVPVRILKATVLFDPYDDPMGMTEMALVPPESPVPVIDSTVDHIETLEDEMQVLDELQAREAKGRAVTLEILGDIPDADLKPPDNVLFVCKLNPETQEEDLELIFSRFGEITSCEIVKDYKTGDSLQYGFIEFERTEDCEDAYFKMQDVLIDDRRIHVNFCQSISKKGMGGPQGGPGGNFNLTEALKKKYKFSAEAADQEEARGRDSSPKRGHRERREDQDETFVRRRPRSPSPYNRREGYSPKNRRDDFDDRRRSEGYDRSYRGYSDRRDDDRRRDDRRYDDGYRRHERRY